jgi:hypothetical protein
MTVPHVNEIVRKALQMHVGRGYAFPVLLLLCGSVLGGVCYLWTARPPE